MLKFSFINGPVDFACFRVSQVDVTSSCWQIKSRPCKINKRCSILLFMFICGCRTKLCLMPVCLLHRSYGGKFVTIGRKRKSIDEVYKKSMSIIVMLIRVVFKYSWENRLTALVILEPMPTDLHSSILCFGGCKKIHMWVSVCLSRSYKRNRSLGNVFRPKEQITTRPTVWGVLTTSKIS